MVVLHERGFDPRGIKESSGVPTLKKKPSGVAENLGLQQEEVRNCSLDHLHGRALIIVSASEGSAPKRYM